MKANRLLEAYKTKIAAADSIYKKNTGKSMSSMARITLATTLNNVNACLTEGFSNSTGTQLSDLGTWKKFCLTVTDIALPNLIAENLVAVVPLKSRTGYISYLKYNYGSTKGGIKQGQNIVTPWGLNARTTDNMRYTSSAVVETVTLEGGKANLAWTPVVSAELVGEASGATIVIDDAKTGAITVTGAAGTTVKVKYLYDNVVIPQNDLPIVNAEMAGVELVAEARRIAVYYSQFAAFQAKQDYGFDLGEGLAKEAAHELAFEIDEEIIHFLDKMAGDAVVTFNTHERVGVGLAEHYAGFANTIEKLKMIVFNRTQKYMPNAMVVSTSIIPVLTLIPGFTASGAIQNGPYFAGTINGVKVFVSPSLAEGRFFLVVNGGALNSAAAVYAPYMPIIPTQLLGYADGGMSQGFSTMYALKELDANLVVAGAIVDSAEPLPVGSVSESGALQNFVITSGN